MTETTSDNHSVVLDQPPIPQHVEVALSPYYLTPDDGGYYRANTLIDQETYTHDQLLSMLADHVPDRMLQTAIDLNPATDTEPVPSAVQAVGITSRLFPSLGKLAVYQHRNPELLKQIQSQNPDQNAVSIAETAAYIVEQQRQENPQAGEPENLADTIIKIADELLADPTIHVEYKKTVGQIKELVDANDPKRMNEIVVALAQSVITQYQLGLPVLTCIVTDTIANRDELDELLWAEIDLIVIEPDKKAAEAMQQIQEKLKQNVATLPYYQQNDPFPEIIPIQIIGDEIAFAGKSVTARTQGQAVEKYTYIARNLLKSPPDAVAYTAGLSSTGESSTIPDLQSMVLTYMALHEFAHLGFAKATWQCVEKFPEIGVFWTWLELAKKQPPEYTEKIVAILLAEYKNEFSQPPADRKLDRGYLYAGIHLLNQVVNSGLLYRDAAGQWRVNTNQTNKCIQGLKQPDLEHPETEPMSQVAVQVLHDFGITSN